MLVICKVVYTLKVSALVITINAVFWALKAFGELRTDSYLYACVNTMLEELLAGLERRMKLACVKFNSKAVRKDIWIIFKSHHVLFSSLL